MTNYTKTNLSDIKVNYLLEEEAAKEITTIDEYISKLTQFDLEARCHKSGATIDDYLKLCKDAVKDFTIGECTWLEWILPEMDRELQRHGMMIPSVDHINLVRTSGKEENDTIAYTRGNNIFLCDKAFENEGRLEHALTHELFHILTRNCPEFKKDMYNIIGYHVMDKSFDYPETKQGWFVSNPDVSNQLCWTQLTVGFKIYDAVTMLFSRLPYHGEPFSKHLFPRFLAIDKNKEFLRDEKGNLVMFGLHECSDSYLSHVGRNTHYLIHEEEVLAENFVYAVLGNDDELPDREIVTVIREAMHYV